MNSFNLVDDEAQRKIQKNKRDMVGTNNNNNNNNTKSDLTKYVDIFSTGVVVGSSASFTLLNGIQGGNDFYQRTNRVVSGKELKINLNFIQHQTAIGYYASDTARVLVVWDHQADATPVASDLLLDINAGGITSTSNLSHKNINNKERFIFLVDERYALPAYSITTVNQINTVNAPHRPNNEKWSETINVKLDSLITRYNGTGSTISAINSGALYLFVLGSNATSGWSINFSARYSFLDV